MTSLSPSLRTDRQSASAKERKPAEKRYNGGETMHNDHNDQIVAIGFFTGPEFKRWGIRLRHVYSLEDNRDFEDLLSAIDNADLNLRSESNQINPRA